MEWWTLGLAVVGAITGVLALTAQVWSFVLSGPRVKVTVANALAPTPGNPTEPRWMLSVDASNIGRLPVTILDVGVAFEAGGKTKRIPIWAMHPAFWSGPPAQPYRLADSEAAGWLVEPAKIVLALQQERGSRDVRGYVRLATGKTMVSANRIDVVHLAQLP